MRQFHDLILAAILTANFLCAVPAASQTFNPFGADTKQRQSETAALEFKTVSLTGEVTEIPLTLTPQAAIKIVNANAGDIYKISVTTDTSGPLSLRLMQFELTPKNQVKKQTSLLRADVSGGQATSLGLSDTLLPTGPVFIGIAGRGELKGTLRIEVDSEKNSKRWEATKALHHNDDRYISTNSSKTCFTLDKTKAGADVSLTTLPGAILAVDILGTGQLKRKEIETYQVESSLFIKGLDTKRSGEVCVASMRSKPPIRLQISASEPSEEPNALLPIEELTELKPNSSLQLNSFPGDVDALKIAPAPEGKAHIISVTGVFGLTACLHDSNPNRYFYNECFTQTRDIGPLKGGDDYILKLSQIYGGDSTYTVSSKLIDFDETVDRYEPTSDVFTAQNTPKINSKSGRILLKGSHISADDKDSYHWADIEKEQLWRVRAIGPGLTGGEISLNGNASVRLTRPPGTKGRLVADDVFLRPGKAEISLRGTKGDYTVFFRPLGPPPKGFELEDGADGKGQKLVFGKSVSGQLRRGDADTYFISLSKPVSASLSITPPLGASTNFSIGDRTWSEYGKAIKPGDEPIELTIPAGDHNLVLKPNVPSPMDYRLTLDRRNPFAIEMAKIDATPEQAVAVRAWADEVQSILVPVQFKNLTANNIDAVMEFETPLTTILSTPGTLYLDANATQGQFVELRVLPDLPPGDYRVMMGLKSLTGEALGFAELVLDSRRDAPSGNGGNFPAVPEPLVGAVDLAHRFRGAKWVAKDAGSRSFIKNLDYALDGLFISQENYQPTFRFGRAKDDGRFDLKLGGEEPVALSGVGFTLVGDWQTPMGNVEIHTSIDGRTFQPWIKGRNDYFNRTQYMTGKERLATHVRLVLPAGEDAPDWTRLSEFHVFATPGKSGLPPQDLLTHGYGSKAHLNDLDARKQSVMKSKTNSYAVYKAVTDGETKTIKGFPISFKNTMQASIEAIELEWSTDRKIVHGTPSKVKIMGANALQGPWEEIGVTDIGDPMAKPVLRYELPERTSVRFIRFDYDVSQSQNAMPAKISVFEQAEGGDYISILGEWGTRSKRVLRSAPKQDGGALSVGASAVKGEVQYKRDDDTWTIDVPADQNTLIFSLEGAPGFTPKVTLSQSGSVIKASSITDNASNDLIKYSYSVAPGNPATLLVQEDKRSTAILIKQSGRLEPYRSRILNGIVELAGDMEAGRDAVALTGVATTPDFNWITDPDKVARNIVDHLKGDRSGGSDAQALTAAAKAIKARTGSKAILFISDGESGDGDPELETALQASGARLFIAKPPGSVVDETYAPANDVLQGWAQIGGGDVQFTSSLSDYENLFSRVSAKLAGPKSYLISVKSETRVLKPGYLTVAAGPKIKPSARPARTQLVLLDTSGSMLKRVGDTRRYLIAKAALADYVSAQEDAKTSDRFDAIGLRVFGGPPDSCETDSVLPAGPLNPNAFTEAVDKVRPRNNAKTPIAQALKAAGGDITNIDGDVSLLLLTDGEETCGGDPLAEIEKLAAGGVKTRLDVVSFALAADIDRSPFEAWAKAGGGQYVDAQDDTDLRDAIKSTRAQGFKIMEGDAVIATGQVGVRSGELRAGTYEIMFDGAAERYPVTVRAGKTSEFTPE